MALFEPGDHLENKMSGDDLATRVLITNVDDILIAAPQHHINVVGKALPEKYVMKCSGKFLSGAQSRLERVDFLGATITNGINVGGTKWCIRSDAVGGWNSLF